MKKIIASALAGLLLFALAACSSGGAPEAPATEGTTIPETVTQAEKETSTEETSAEGTAIEATAAVIGETSAGEAAAAPTGKAEILALYNGALGKSGDLSRTAYSYDILAALFTNVRLAGLRTGDMDMLDEINEPYRYYRDNRRMAHDLVRLTDAQVSSAALKKQDGKLATYEIQLKSATAEQSMQNGHAGYSGLVTFPEIDMLMGLASEGQPYTAAVDKFTMSNGKLLVTIDLESGVIQSAECTFTQDVAGPLRLTWYFIPGTTDFVLKLTAKSTYKI